jgi:hypothetical protein
MKLMKVSDAFAARVHVIVNVGGPASTWVEGIKIKTFP